MQGRALIACGFCGERDVVTIQFEMVERTIADVEVVEKDRVEAFWRRHLEPYARALS